MLDEIYLAIYHPRMEYQLYPFRLYKGDQEHRKFLEKYYKKKLKRKIDFSMILRHLMDKEVMDIRGEVYQVGLDGIPSIVSSKDIPSCP